MASMRMYTRAFNKMVELEQFVNERDISKDQIVSISQSSDQNYFLVYYAEE